MSNNKKEPSINDDVLKFASEQYGFDKEKLHYIYSFCNLIYVFPKDKEWYILRIGKRPISFVNQIKAELDWMTYLKKNEMKVPAPLYTLQNEKIITIQIEDINYIICVYSALGDKHWDKNNPELWNKTIFYNWGKMMGDMHRLTKDYKPKNDIDVREHFNKFTLSDSSIKHIPNIIKIADDLHTEFETYPKDKDSYGLIHADFHQWNFLIRDNQINLFDFDDALYGWFAYDIGVALYHALWWGRTNESGYDFTNDIISNFLKGYFTANQLDDFWLSKIPIFMRYRQICKLSWFLDPDNIDDHQKERISNIEKGILFTGFELDETLFIKEKL